MAGFDPEQLGKDEEVKAEATEALKKKRSPKEIRKHAKDVQRQKRKLKDIKEKRQGKPPTRIEA